MLLYLAGVAGALSFVHAVARFRVYIVPLFLVYASVCVALAWDAPRKRRAAPVLAALVACAAGWPLQRLAEGPHTMATGRPADYGTALTIALAAARSSWPRAPRSGRRTRCRGMRGTSTRSRRT